MGAINNIVRSVSPKSVFPSAVSVVTSAVSYNQGDLLVFDDTNNRLKVPAAETEGNTFVGVAINTVVSGKLVGPYTGIPDAVLNTATPFEDMAGPLYGVVVRCVAKTGVAFAPGDLVFLDPATGTTGVTTTGTKSIGVYQGGTIASATAGQQVDCLLMARFPNDTVKS